MVEKQCRTSRNILVIVAQQSTETISTHDRTALAAERWLWSNTLIAEALVIVLSMIMRQILLDHLGQRPLAQQDYLIHGLLRDGAHKPFTVGVEIGTPRW